MKTQFRKADHDESAPPPGFEIWRIDASGRQWLRTVQTAADELPVIRGIPEQPSANAGAALLDKLKGWIFS